MDALSMVDIDWITVVEHAAIECNPYLPTQTGPSWRAFLVMLGFNLSYVTVANGLVWLEPLAAGSGIPEIKSFLNGIDLPRVVSLSKGGVCVCGGGVMAWHGFIRTLL